MEYSMPQLSLPNRPSPAPPASAGSNVRWALPMARVLPSLSEIHHTQSLMRTVGKCWHGRAE